MKSTVFYVLYYVLLFGSVLTSNGMKRTLDDLYASQSESIDTAETISYDGIHQSAVTFLPNAIKKACYICFKAQAVDEFFPMSCGHRKVCISCLGDIIKVALDLKSSLYLRCIDWDCKKPFEWEELKQLVQSDKLQVFDEIMLSEYLATHKDIQYCPHSNCGYAFIASNQRCTVTCDKCKNNFCSVCLIDHYWITPCSIAHYLKSDAESLLWITSNTKPCPKCAMAIEKKGGCSSMQCSRCETDFQW